MADSYGSHCDNGEVSISNIKNKYLQFVIDTATGGNVTIKIPLHECVSAINSIIAKL